jgi:putative Holliday junction resolvase
VSGRSGQKLGDELPFTGRLVAIDLGEVRVGLAVSDPGQVVASPAETVQVPRDADALAVDALAGAAARHEAAALVVGLPRRLDGGEDAPATRARWFADQLRERTGLPVALRDERFTTVEAERVLLDADVSRTGRRASIDRVAASVMLQGVLESQRRLRTDTDTATAKDTDTETDRLAEPPPQPPPPPPPSPPAPPRSPTT